MGTLWYTFTYSTNTIDLQRSTERRGMLKKHLHTYSRSQAFLWNKNCVCKKEQNASLIRMWQEAIFPWSQPLRTEHYQQSGKGSECQSKNVILSHLSSRTSSIMQLAVLILHSIFFAWADFPLRDTKIMTPSFNICSSIKKCLCQSCSVWALPVQYVHSGSGSSGMLSTTSHEVSETLGCHDNTQGPNFSADFLSRQNKYSIPSLHLFAKGIIYSLYALSKILEKTYKNQRVTNRSLLHLYLKLLKRGAFVRFK